MIGGRGASQMSNTFSVLCRAKRRSPPLLHGGVDISAYVVGTAEHRDGVARRREQLAAVRGELRVAGLLAAISSLATMIIWLRRNKPYQMS